MAAEALAHLTWPSPGAPELRVHFVSNPDAWALHSVLRNLNARRTLVIISSKTFTTPGNHDQRRLRAALAGRCGP